MSNAEDFKRYRSKSIVEARPYVPGEIVDSDFRPPKIGDMICRDPKDHFIWLLTTREFIDRFEECEDD